MDLDEVTSLKVSGDNAFTDGNLDLALESYNKAIVLVGDGDNEALGILLTNRAQFHLMLERYELALRDAEHSLEHHPKFKKTLLRRAMANVELGNHKQAMEQLRQFYKLEPENTSVLTFLDRASSKDKMNEKLRIAYAGHAFRRALDPSSSLVAFNSLHQYRKFGNKLMLQVFLSKAHVLEIHKFFHNFAVTTSNRENLKTIYLSEWFMTKRMKLCGGGQLCACVSDIFLNFFLRVVKPSNLMFIVKSGDFARAYFSFMQNKRVMVAEAPRYRATYRATLIACASELTHLTLEDHFLSTYKNVEFPNIDYLRVPQDIVVASSFLKVWNRKQLKIGTLDLHKTFLPDLSNFKNFGEQVSDKLFNVVVLLSPTYNRYTSTNQFERVNEDLQVLKGAFPNLKNIIGRLSLILVHKDFGAAFQKTLIKYFAYLEHEVKTKLKPEWCDQLKILVEISVQLGRDETFETHTEWMEKMVSECRRDYDMFKKMRLCGPSFVSVFNDSMVVGSKMIEVETDDAHFQILFKADKRPRSR